MSRARDIANSTTTLDVDGTIKLDGNYPVGSNNVALGDTALDSLTTAASNTAIGYLALTSSNADNNTAVGAFAGDVISSGQNNTTVGASSMGNMTTGSDNTALGHNSMNATTTGINNTAIGKSALSANTTGSFSTAVGYLAAQNATAGGTVALGHSSAKNNQGAGVTAVGSNALLGNTTGFSNTAVGTDALGNNTTSSYNTAVGRQALENNTGGANTAVGFAAMDAVTTGANNTAVGVNALGALTTGSFNVGISDGAGDQITTGSKNTILGRYNGNQGGLDIRTSNNNIVLSDGDGNPRVRINSGGTVEFNGAGSWTGDSGGLRVGSYVSILREDAGLLLGRNTTTGIVAYFYGNGTNVGNISVTGSSTSYNTSSDYRLKENVVELTGATDRLKQIPVHQFNFIGEPDRTVDGFLAHEVQAIVPEAIHGTKDEVDADGNPVYQGIDQSKLVPLLTAALQEALQKIDALEARVATLEGGA